MKIELKSFGTELKVHSTLLILADESLREALTNTLVAELSEEFQVYFVMSPLPAKDKVIEYTDELAKEILNQGVKRATVLGLGPASGVVQALAVRKPKLVRRVVLVDASTRLKPTKMQRLVDRVERFLPLGLPLRASSSSFDSRPMLHRIHCPTLLLLSKDSNKFLKQQSAFLQKKIPNAWAENLNSSPANGKDAYSAELHQHIHSFLQVPVKRPQRALRP